MQKLPPLSRRTLVKTATLAAAGLILPRHAGAMSTETVGNAEVTILSDGNLMLPLDFVFPDAPQAELRALLEADGQPTDMLTPDCNITLVRSGDRLVLFDVGAGPNFMPSAGSLADSLAEAGIEPSEITDVVFTHAHPDHLWGLVDDFDELVFPEADYHMNAVEWDYWRAPNTLDNTPEARKSFVVGARNRFDYLEERINLFAFGDEVIAGIEAVDTSGHTPGHTSFAVHSGSESVLVVGDAVTNVAVSFAKPDWPSGSDQDAARGAATRLTLLDRMATDQMRMVGFHMPHPGLGRVERDGTGYRFVTG